MGLPARLKASLTIVVGQAPRRHKRNAALNGRVPSSLKEV